MCITALVAGSLASTAIGASSASKAAKTQAAAADSANATQRYIFDRSVELSEPQREIGMQGLNALAGHLGLKGSTSLTPTPVAFSEGSEPTNALSPTFDIANTPGYQFRRDEGMKAIERGASARGLRMSGATMKEFQRYGDGLASQEYGNHLNRLASVAGIGQTATQSQINAGQNYANAYGQNALAAGNARASGYQGVNNAVQGGFNNMFNIYGMQQAGLFS